MRRVAQASMKLYEELGEGMISILALVTLEQNPSDLMG
jgi:hypothetical protein